ncbi:MAG: YihY/virulence factor BrkB family protein [Opitutae bacterium]|nr:YihY/virulence factor BrkB family protein [Opitutae bacterium]
MGFLTPHLARLKQLWHRDIWLASVAREHALRRRTYLALRMLSITLSGLHEIKVAARAAALSYSSMLALGPLIALSVLIAGFALGDRDPDAMARDLNRVIGFIAPQVREFDKDAARAAAPSARAAAPSARPAARPPAEPRAENRPPPPVRPVAPADPELVRVISNFITHSRSGAAGAIGGSILLLIVLQLFSSVENTFNDIWGVRRGRSWMSRLVIYWAAVSLGAVLFFASFTLLSAGPFVSVWVSKLPIAADLRALYQYALPALSGALLVMVLTVFYRVVPNTRVRWGVAIVGALIVAALLFLNNYLAFLYLQGVLRSKSLYGSVGLLPILMAGLYVFWFIVLVGGQITYALQNIHYRSSQAAWRRINEATRESLSLLVLLLTARRFRDCQPPYSGSQLSRLVRVPAQILNESLNRLCDLGLVAQLPPTEGNDPNDHRYQPARPLNRITLAEFKRLFENYGEAPGGDMLEQADPILAHYRAGFASALPAAFGGKSLDTLIDELPLAPPAERHDARQAAEAAHPAGPL